MKICIITGTRAEYGLLKKLMLGIKKEKKFKLCILVTGAHLSRKFGNSYRDIVKDGFKISRKIYINPNSDTSSGIVKSISSGMEGFVNAYKKLNPDLVLVLGDRHEIFSAVIAAYFILWLQKNIKKRLFNSEKIQDKFLMLGDWEQII